MALSAEKVPDPALNFAVLRLKIFSFEYYLISVETIIYNLTHQIHGDSID